MIKIIIHLDYMNSNGYEQEVNHVLTDDNIRIMEGYLHIKNLFDVIVSYNLSFIKKYEITECSEKESTEVQSKIDRRNK